MNETSIISKPMWYLDCFCYANSRSSPVNTYCCKDLECLMEQAEFILTRDTGIDEVRIGKETLGQNPMDITL